jgi:hypothetical protein
MSLSGAAKISGRDHFTWFRGTAMLRLIRFGCAAAILMLPLFGCRFFGIDNRPDIEYATITERRPVKEPMYQRQVPGTNLVKRWPARRGLAYGYAPWENKQDAVMVAQQGQGETPTTSGAAGQAAAPESNSPSASPARKTVKTAMADSQVKQAADWSPRHEGELNPPKSPLKTPVERRAPIGAKTSSPTGLHQPQTVVPAVHQEIAEGDEEAPAAPENRSNLPNVDDPSDVQGTPDDESPGAE